MTLGASVVFSPSGIIFILILLFLNFMAKSIPRCKSYESDDGDGGPAVNFALAMKFHAGSDLLHARGALAFFSISLWGFLFYLDFTFLRIFFSEVKRWRS